ncbi:MAG: ABC transporter substrate-binding protein [Clostridia bacterium]|nr:ABC transporter substrate-binding protein [Clostridia bacterium]
MKKLTAILLVCLLLIAPLSGCEKKEDTITLRWTIMMSEQKDLSMVLEKANEMLKDLLPGVKLNLECVDSLPDKWSMWMSSGEPIDLAWSGYSFDMASEIKKNSYIGLNELVEKYAPHIKQEIEDYDYAYNATTIDGELYAIPHIQYYVAETTYMTIPTELEQYMDSDALLNAAHGSPTTQEDFFIELDNYFQNIKQADAWDTDTVGRYINNLKNFMQFVLSRGFEYVGCGTNTAYICYEAFDPNAEIKCFLETEQFKMFMKYVRKWYEDGIISPDILTGGGGDASRQSIMGGHTVENWYNVDDERGIKRKGDLTYYLLEAKENKWQGVVDIVNEATCTVIPYTAKHPEEAIQLVDLLHSEEGKELLNLLCYGIEGVHYDKIGENRIQPYDYDTQGDANSAYGIPNWMLGNLNYVYEVPVVTEGQPEYVDNYNRVTRKEQHKSALYNFRVDNSNVTKEISQVTAVFAEYLNQLVFGVSADYEKIYNEMIKKAEKAGLRTIIEDFQKQADAYMESNK